MMRQNGEYANGWVIGAIPYAYNIPVRIFAVPTKIRDETVMTDHVLPAPGPSIGSTLELLYVN